MVRASLGVLAASLFACGPLPCKSPEQRARLAQSVASPEPAVYHAYEYFQGDEYEEFDFVFVGEGGRVLRFADEQMHVIHTGTTATLRGMTSGSAPPLVVAVGDGGAVQRSYDYGHSWSPGDSGTQADLHGVELADGLEGGRFAVAVGDGVVLRSFDDGATWSPATLPTGAERLRDVRKGGDGWLAIGEHGVILTATYDADVWYPSASPTDQDLRRFSDAGILGANGLLLTGGPGDWQPVELPWSGEIADATTYTLVMRDGRMAIAKDSFDPTYVPLPVEDPLPAIQRRIWETEDGVRLLAEDGSIHQVDFVYVDTVTEEVCVPAAE